MTTLNFKKLDKAFYLNDTLSVAQQLLGKILVKIESDGKILTSKIVETEAYLSIGDMASHSFKGKTIRNSAMFEEGGILYVYKIFGIHYCINVVTRPNGIGEAVLIRASQAIDGIELMAKRRGLAKVNMLCKGPGNLAKAYGIDLGLNFTDLCSDILFIATDGSKPDKIMTTSRIGIAKSEELPYRFFISHNNCVSGKKS